VIRVEVTAEDIAAVPTGWCEPVERAIGRLTGQPVDVDGDSSTGCVATIGLDEWVVVVELPAAANAWLNARWDDGFVAVGEPFHFDLIAPEWLVALVSP